MQSNGSSKSMHALIFISVNCFRYDYSIRLPSSYTRGDHAPMVPASPLDYRQEQTRSVNWRYARARGKKRHIETVEQCLCLISVPWSFLCDANTCRHTPLPINSPTHCLERFVCAVGLRSCKLSPQMDLLPSICPSPGIPTIQDPFECQQYNTNKAIQTLTPM